MFTKELIDHAIEYFKDKHGHIISNETAEIYLNSLADLYGSFYQMLQEEQNLKENPTQSTI